MAGATHGLRVIPPPAAEPAGDREAAFDRCADALYRYFVVRTRDVHLADDLMQQLWLAAQQLGPTVPDELEYRLRAIARNLLRTYWRRQQRLPTHVPLVDPDLAAELAERLVSKELPDAELCRAEVREQLLLALTELPAQQQALLIGHYFEQRDHAELAAQFGISLRAIEGRLYRARRALRERLQHMELL